MSGLPIGFRFKPSEIELLVGYLQRKVKPQPLPWNGIEERVMYGVHAHPTVVFPDADSWEIDSVTNVSSSSKKKVKKVNYFFTRLNKLGNGKKNMTRGAGGGLWHGETKPVPVGVDIGYMKMFTYHPESRNKEGKGKKNKTNMWDDEWSMHEYSFCDKYLNKIGVCGGTDYVICKITKIVYLDDMSKTNLVASHVVSQEHVDLGKRKASGDDSFSRQRQQPRKIARGDLHQDVYVVDHYSRNGLQDFQNAQTNEGKEVTGDAKVETEQPGSNWDDANVAVDGSTIIIQPEIVDENGLQEWSAGDLRGLYSYMGTEEEVDNNKKKEVVVDDGLKAIGLQEETANEKMETEQSASIDWVFEPIELNSDDFQFTSLDEATEAFFSSLYEEGARFLSNEMLPNGAEAEGKTDSSKQQGNNLPNNSNNTPSIP